MKYRNHSVDAHDRGSKTGVLLVNLGTPEAPNRKALRRYLKQFLSDPRVVEPTMPRWLWWLVLNGVILTLRPSRSAKAYQTVWDHLGEGTGSPLMHISKQQAKAMAQALGDEFVVELAMTYGQPSIQSALQRLHEQRIERLLVLPLYPQYSATTTAAVFDQVTKELNGWRRVPELRMVGQYHDHPKYIDALAQSVRNYWQKHGQAEQMVMSFHGIPLRYLKNGDPYFCHCHKTGRLLAEALGLEAGQYQVTFQSIFGREPWLQPYTNQHLQTSAENGVRSVQIICPGFAADCLETIEEIAIENRDVFLQAGGEQYQYIPALNDGTAHMSALVDVVNKHAQGWKNSQPNTERFKQSFADMD